MTIVGIILILFGGLVLFANWRIVYEWYRYKRSSSLIPLMGGLFFALGVYCVYPTGFAFLALFVDPGTYSVLCAIPLIAKDAWQTSRFSLIRQFTGKLVHGTFKLKLFRSGVFVIKIDFDPPQIMNKHGAKIISTGVQGRWQEDTNCISLNGYRDNRKTILIKLGDSTYFSEESNYPEDEHYNYDSLDKIEFRLD